MMNLSSLSKAKYASVIAMISAMGSTIAHFVSMPYAAEISMLLLFVTLALLGAVFFFVTRSEKEINKMEQVCQSLAKGNFDVRLTGIREQGNLGQLQWSFNAMVDTVDAFVREATATMDHVSCNRYFRRILENGMQGSFLNAASR